MISTDPRPAVQGRYKQSRRYDHLPAESKLESGTFFWKRTLFLDSKLEIENYFSRIQNGIQSFFGIRNRVLKAIFGIQKEIQHCFLESKLESDSKFLESDDTFGNRKYNPMLFKESDFISTTLDMKKVANGDRGRRFTNDDSQLWKTGLFTQFCSKRWAKVIIVLCLMGCFSKCHNLYPGRCHFWI